MTEYTFPTAEEIEQIERRASAMRAEVLANGVKALIARISALGHAFQRTVHN